MIIRPYGIATGRDWRFDMKREIRADTQDPTLRNNQIHHSMKQHPLSESDKRENMSPKRRNLRLPEYDYAQEGAYFVTVCTKNKECLFGDIVSEKMVLNDAGRTVEQCWQEIPMHFPHVVLDYFVVMPTMFTA